MILERSKKLNSILIISDNEHKEVVLDTLNDIPEYAVEASVDKIKLLKSFEGGRFKFELNLSKGTTEEFWENITKPLYLSSIELMRRQNILLDLVKKKDREIAEYKAEGAELLRKNIETKVFDENQLEIETIGVEEKNYADSFQSLVQFYNTSISKKIVKVEDATAVVTKGATTQQGSQSISNLQLNNVTQNSSHDPNKIKQEPDDKSTISVARPEKRSKSKISTIPIMPIIVPSKKSKESLNNFIR